ncbi:DUF2510 domain-containing protein [Aquihabitans sp. G128]|uniref:DUF2510 domain-containing protein n=1 Tax=Aquihabitans sp. G128 TaxID=2849779 RepID=UPI001C241B76|nr:DUF2510 domain-containing protein [Aquihabitans sp. G128]QXC63226.1 DUF2510 domain-containing protein [Aquihabitans sp. G128]
MDGPGWHVDPQHQGGQRWWDGQGWTDITRVPALVDAKQLDRIVHQLSQIRIGVTFLAAVAVLGLIGGFLAAVAGT